MIFIDRLVIARFKILCSSWVLSRKKYLWLKKEYDKLIILEANKPELFELGHNHDGQNIHYSYTDKVNKTSS